VESLRAIAVAPMAANLGYPQIAWVELVISRVRVPVVPQTVPRRRTVQGRAPVKRSSEQINAVVLMLMDSLEAPAGSGHFAQTAAGQGLTRLLRISTSSSNVILEAPGLFSRDSRTPEEC
jgi:hypothetical protein